MGKALKSIGSLGGAVLGGVVGGPAGALIGGSLGSSLGQGDAPDVSAMARQAGFSGNIEAPGYALRGNNLLKRDITPGKIMFDTANELRGVANRTGGLRTNLAGMRASLTGVGGELAALRADVRPGFGRLTEARVRSIKDAGAESIGNMRESLARRNVLGSSFANDALGRQQLAIGQEVERARAEAFVEEIGMSRQLLMDEISRVGAELGLSVEERQIYGQQAQALSAQAQVVANQMDRELQELSVAGAIRNGVSQAISAQAIQQAQLQMLNAQNQNELAGLMTAGAMGLFRGGGSAMTSTNAQFGRGAFGLLGNI